MNEYPTNKIRNIALVSHSGAGKTTFVDRLLFDTGATKRMGSVDNGTATTDFEPEEIGRKSSISMGIAAVESRGTKLNLLDTPGYADFVGDVHAALRAADSVAVFIEAVSGVEVGTEAVWSMAKQAALPTLLVVNKMDRDNVKARRIIPNIQENLIDDRRIVPLQLPIGEGSTFKGVIDLVTMRCYGKKDEQFPIPEEMAEAAAEARTVMLEAAAEGKDNLMEKYFENDDLEHQEIIEGLKAAVNQNLCVPITFCAGLPGIGTEILMRVMERLAATPAEESFMSNDDIYEVSDAQPLSALVFKTRENQYGRTSYVRVYGGVLSADSRVYDAQSDSEVRVGSIGVMRGKDVINVPKLHAGDIGAIVKLGDTVTNATLTQSDNPLALEPVSTPNPIFQLAIHPQSQSDIAKLNEAISRLQGEDPTLKLHHERATHQTILSGMGDTHLNMAVKKLSSKFGVNVTTTTPLIPYKETCTGASEAEYTHKKQSGGAGQYGRVQLRVESLDDDAEFEFDQEIFGGSISSQFVTATEKGCRQACESGPIAGYPVSGVRAVVYDGKMHPVDSKEIAFQIAGREAFRAAMMDAKPALLEPLYNVTVTVPAENMGDVMSDFNTRRASVQGMEQVASRAIIRAEVPLAEMQKYLVDLRSITQGRGVYSMAFSRYGRVPSHLQQKVVESAQLNGS